MSEEIKNENGTESTEKEAPKKEKKKSHPDWDDFFFSGTSHRKRYRFLWKRNRYLGGVCHGWLFPLLHFANDFPVGGQQFDPCVIESQQ